MSPWLRRRRAILTVASAGGEVGPERLSDALIGAGVALAFSQFLFSPEPVALLRRAETAALGDMSVRLELTARALERDDDESNERALNSLRDLRDGLVELTRLRRNASSRVARHSLIWRSQIRPVVREQESAVHLDLLGGSCLMLTRATIAVEPPERHTLASSVRELAGVLGELAKELGDRKPRQQAADRALDIARRLAGTGVPPESALAAALMSVRMVAATLSSSPASLPDKPLTRCAKGPENSEFPPRRERAEYNSSRTVRVHADECVYIVGLSRDPRTLLRRALPRASYLGVTSGTMPKAMAANRPYSQCRGTGLGPVLSILCLRVRTLAGVKLRSQTCGTADSRRQEHGAPGPADARTANALPLNSLQRWNRPDY